MILADTSAWVEYDRATGSDTHRRLRALIEDRGELAVTEPVVMEIVSGARSDDHASQLRRLLSRFRLLSFDVGDFDGALHIFRTCRSAGVTPRGFVDCMIAAVALRNGATLLTCDADLRRVASVFDIRVDRAST